MAAKVLLRADRRGATGHCQARPGAHHTRPSGRPRPDHPGHRPGTILGPDRRESGLLAADRLRLGQQLIHAAPQPDTEGQNPRAERAR
jgi:hypothetical protein